MSMTPKELIKAVYEIAYGEDAYLRGFFPEEVVERLVDNMSTKDLVRYVFDDMTDYVNKQSPVEFFDDAYSYFDDYFDEIVEEIKGGQSVNDLD